MVSFIDANRDELGVEPICTTLQFAPSTYYAAKSRPPSARAMRDAVTAVTVLTLWKANYSVYPGTQGVEGTRSCRRTVGRDQVARWRCLGGPIKEATLPFSWSFAVRPLGFEPRTCGLRVRCSAVELEARRGPE